MLVALWSPKGGSGTSVVAAAVGLASAAKVETRLVDLTGDQPAILGLPPVTAPTSLADWMAAGGTAPTELLDDLIVPVAPGLSLLPGDLAGWAGEPSGGAALAVALRDQGVAVVDAGSGPDGSGGAVRAVIEVADAALVVLRPCYLALRRAVSDPRLRLSTGVVVVEEPGRALSADDVSAVLGVPVVGRVPVRSGIARAVDAGVLPHRLPDPLAAAATAVLAASGAGGRWAA